MTVTCDDVKALAAVSDKLTAVDRLVLVAHKACANETRDGEAVSWPAVKLIAEFAGVLPRQVHRSRARLVQLGLLTPRGRSDGRADRRTRAYRVDLTPVDNTERGVRADRPCKPRGVHPDTRGVSGWTPEEKEEATYVRLARGTHEGGIYTVTEQESRDLFDQLRNRLRQRPPLARTGS